MKIDLNLEEIKILINWAEYKSADLPFNIDENTLRAKLYEARKNKQMTLEEAEEDFYKTQELWILESEEENAEKKSWQEEQETQQRTVRNNLQ